MKAKTKILSIVLTAAVAFAAAFALSGCADGEYPVKVGNVEVKSRPEAIVVLDAPTADILMATGYDSLMVGRSDEVDQEAVSVAPSMGAAQSPDVDKIIESGATIVFAGENMSEDSRDKLEEKGVQVIEIAHAETPNEVETNYITIGKICGGTTTGAEKGESSYEKLTQQLEAYKQQVTKRNSGILDTVCYIYTEDGELKMMTSGTYGDMLLDYTGAVNAAVNVDSDALDVSTLMVANPKYIFYSDDATLSAIQSDVSLSTLSAVKSGSMLKVTLDEMSRPGTSAVTTLEKMIYFMYPDLNTSSTATADTASSSSAADTQTTTAAADASSSSSSSSTSSVAESYGITLTSELSFAEEDESDEVKAMQQRLYDLGYIDDEENITGYYGEVTAAAVGTFQKNNGIEESGSADNATLTSMFSSSAKSAS